MPCRRYIDQEGEGNGRLPVMCLADTNYTTTLPPAVSLHSLYHHTYIYCILFIYMAKNDICLLLFFSGIVFINFRVLWCCAGVSLPFLLFVVFFLIYRSAIDPAIHSGELTNNIHFILSAVFMLPELLFSIQIHILSNCFGSPQKKNFSGYSSPVFFYFLRQSHRFKVFFSIIKKINSKGEARSAKTCQISSLSTKLSKFVEMVASLEGEWHEKGSSNSNSTPDAHFICVLYITTIARAVFFSI